MTRLGFAKTLVTPIRSQRHIIPGLSVMDRYLLGEFIQPFIFGLGAFTAFGISVGAVFDLVRKVTEDHLPLGVALKIFALQLPYFFALAVPMAALLACLMAYSRMANDSELIALRSCGVSLYRLMVPALIFSLGVTGLAFALNELVVPPSNYTAAIALEKALKQEQPNFQSNNILYREYQKIKRPDGQREKVLSRLFYAQKFDGERMYQLTVLDFSTQGVDQILSAASAQWDGTANQWLFYDGTIYGIASDGSFKNIIRFRQQSLPLPRTPLDLAQRVRDYGEMSIAQALNYLDVLDQGGNEDKVLKLRVRIHQKFAFPFICVVFGIVGATLGTSPRRTGRATSFGLSILIIFVYYLLAFVSGALGQLAVLSPFIAAWLPNFVGMGAGGVLLIRAAR